VQNERENPVSRYNGAKKEDWLEEFLVVVPTGAANAGWTAPRPCKIWGIDYQIQNGPGTGALLSIQRASDSNVVVSFAFDKNIVPRRDEAFIDVANHELAKGDSLVFVKAHNDQGGWCQIHVGFDPEKVAPPYVAP
jgi:hypothetical protein